VGLVVARRFPADLVPNVAAQVLGAVAAAAVLFAIAGARLSVAPRITNRKPKVSTTSHTSAATSE